jgi:hypothetical protein
MSKKNITINDLVVMVQKGFNDVSSKMATKGDLNELKGEMNQCFDKIEKLILADHKKRIERLEFEVKELKDLLAFK